MSKRSMELPTSSAAAHRRDAAIPILPTLNAALKEIANRIVTQQLAAESAPVALDITLKKTNRASAWLASAARQP